MCENDFDVATVVASNMREARVELIKRLRSRRREFSGEYRARLVKTRIIFNGFAACPAFRVFFRSLSLSLSLLFYSIYAIGVVKRGVPGVKRMAAIAEDGMEFNYF